MQELTPNAQQTVERLAAKYGVSSDAVATLLRALAAGNGSMAQFHHPELGGAGQWMQGGMTMVGDMFNHGLKMTVNGLCSELASLLHATQVFAPAPSSTVSSFSANAWWPAELGSPAASGSQNQMRYAYFPGARRLALNIEGHVTVYDTLDHQIGGVQQQQGGSQSLFFTSQRGTFTVDSLPLVGRQGSAVQPQSVGSSSARSQPQAGALQPQPIASSSAHSQPQSSAVQPQSVGSSSAHSQPQGNAPPAVRDSAASTSVAADHDVILSTLERLAKLHAAGALSDQEFQQKKAELLARL